MRALLLGLLACAIAQQAAYGANSYQSTQREKAYEAWRERAFFDSSSSRSSAPAARSSPVRQYRDYSADGAMLEQQRRVNAEYKREVAAYNERLARQIVDAQLRRTEAYRQARLQAKGRLPLHEPPDFPSESDMAAWYAREASRASADDSFVLWVAASFAMRGQDYTEARRLVGRADPSWPEVQALLGRLLLLGEGGPADSGRGWALLRAAEKALQTQPFEAPGRLDLYYAKGRGLAEGIGVSADPLAALLAFDETENDTKAMRASLSYLHEVFWARVGDGSAQLIQQYRALPHRWYHDLEDSLEAASAQRRSPAQIAAEKARLGHVLASMDDLLGNPELKYQLFLVRYGNHRRTGPEGLKVEGAIAELEKRGLKRIAVERLLPDRYGGFLEADTPAEHAAWLTSGRPLLDELAARHAPRALAAEAWLALHPREGEASFPDGERWAEQGLQAGDPWGAMFVAMAWLQRGVEPAADQEKAVGWYKRVDAAANTPLVAEELAESIFLPDDLETEDIMRTHYRRLGAAAGNKICALAQAEVYERRLSLRLANDAADQRLWSKADEVLSGAMARARDDTDKAELARARESLRDRRSHYDERRLADHVRRENERAENDGRQAAASTLARQAYLAKVAAQGPGAAARLAERWSLLVRKLADPATRWDWSVPEMSHPDAQGFVTDEQMNVRRLVAACENAEGAHEGNILRAPASLREGETVLGTTASRALREALTRAFVSFAATRADAASVLALELAPSPVDPLLVRTLDGELHTARWLRQSLKLGRLEAIFELTNHFHEQPEVMALYQPADERAHDGDKSPELLAAVVALLPTEGTERPAIEASVKSIAQRRANALRLIELEAAGSSTRATAALVAFEAAATSASRAGSAVFFKWDAEPTLPAADADLGQLPPSEKIVRLLLAHHMDRAATGDMPAAERAAELWGQIEAGSGARMIAALRTLLVADAGKGSLPAMRKLIALYRPDDETTPLAGWPRDENAAVAWSRRALLAGAAEVLEYPAQLFSGQMHSRLYDTKQFAAWTQFATKFKTDLGEEPTAEQTATFAKNHLPPE